MTSPHPHAPKPPKFPEIEHCPDCSSQLQQCDNLKYCSNCRRCPTLMDNCLREPNYNFKLNYQEHRVSGVAKIQMYSKDILCKIGVRLTDGEIQGIVEKVRAMHRRRGLNCKGYRQESAVVIFKQFEDQIRMTAHQFCLKAGIARKKFNKMYLQYQNIVKNMDILSSTPSKPKLEQDIYEEDLSAPLKHQQRQESQVEESKQKEEEMDHFSLSFGDQHLKMQEKELLKREKKEQEEHEHQGLGDFSQQQQRVTLTKTLQKLYDKIFPHVYLKNHKQELMRSILQKSLAIFKASMQNSEICQPRKYFRAPAIIYNVIKMHGYKISKRKYVELVERYLEVRITDGMIAKFAGLCRAMAGSKQKVEEDDQGSSPTSLENRNESPTGSQNLLGV